jgi:hypothetical protein
MYVTLGTAANASIYPNDNYKHKESLPTYTVKKVIDFPVTSRDVTYQILPGRE